MHADPRYGAEVLRRFRELPGAGDATGDAGVINARADAADDGARVVLSLRIERGVVVEARFRAYGCPYFIAAASWLTDRLGGATRREARRMGLARGGRGARDPARRGSGG